MTGMQVLQMLGEMRPGSLEPVQQVARKCPRRRRLPWSRN